MSGDVRGGFALICRRYHIDALYAFGSRSLEVSRLVQFGQPLTGSTGSDIDIGVLPQPGGSLDPLAKVRLMAELEDLLGAGRVDLVSLTEASSSLAVDIVRGELLYEADPDHTAEYELFVLRRAADVAPFERERVRDVLAGVAT
jgi:predicted nucleotidyltransferase